MASNFDPDAYLKAKENTDTSNSVDTSHLPDAGAVKLPETVITAKNDEQAPDTITSQSDNGFDPDAYLKAKETTTNTAQFSKEYDVLKNTQQKKYPQFSGSNLAEDFPTVTKALFGQSAEENEAKQKQIYIQGKQQGLSDSEIHNQMTMDNLKSTVKGMVHMAPFLVNPAMAAEEEITAGLVSKANAIQNTVGRVVARVMARATVPSVKFGIINGLADTIKGFIDNKSVSESVEEGGKTMGESILFGIPLSMGGQLVQKAGEVAGEKVGEMAGRALEKKGAKEEIERLSSLEKRYGFRSTKYINMLQNKMDEFKNGAKEKIGKISEYRPDIEAIQGNIESVNKRLDSLENSTIKTSKELLPIASKAINEVKDHFTEQYNNFLKGPSGANYVDLNPTKALIQENLGDTSGPIPPITAKNMSGDQFRKSLTNGWDNFLDAMSQKNQFGVPAIDTLESKTKKLLKNSFEKIDSGMEITVSEAHKFKQAIQEAASSIKASSQSDTKFALNDIAKSVENAIDPNGDNGYKEISKNYWGYIQQKNLIDSQLGKFDPIAETRKSIPKAINDFKKVISEGKDATDQYVQTEYQRVKALFAQVKLFNDNGLYAKADEIQGKLQDIAHTTLNKQPLLETKKFFQSELSNLPKESPEAIAIKDVLAQDIQGIQNKIKQTRTNSLNVKQKIYEKSQELKKILPEDNSMMDNIALTVLSTKLGVLAPILKKPLNAMVGVQSFNKYGDLGALQAKKAIEAIESSIGNKFSTLSQPIKYAAFRIIKNIKDGIQ